MTTLRVAICGSGNRSRQVWQRHVRNQGGMELVGVQDVARASLDQAQALGNISPSQAFMDLETMLAETRPDALIVVPIHSVHAAAIEAGLNAGCHVLVEKPFTTDLAAAIRLTELSEQKQLRLGVVQNWRTKSVGQTLQRAIREGRIGEVSHIFFRYLRDREAPTLPAYLFEEDDPLLYAMSIHHFDLFRYVLGQEIVRVEGHAFRPAWSRYQKPSSMQLWMETDRGVMISYVATFSSRNAHLAQESLQVEGELGTLANESAFSEPPLWLSLRGAQHMVDLTEHVTVRDQKGQYEQADTAVLRNFVRAVRGEEALVSPARENLGTLAVIEAARLCYRQRKPVDPRQLLTGGRAQPA